MSSLIPLSKSGPCLSRLILGTWRWLDQAPTPSAQALNRFIHQAVELGITTLDTAEIYGDYDMETALGEALALSPALRDQVQIITKAGIYVPNKYHPERPVAFYNTSAARLQKSLEKSLRFLKIDQVDLFLVHRPDFLTPAADTAEGLDTILEKGLASHVGVSNYSTSQFETLQQALSQPLVTNQVEYSLLHMEPLENGVLDQCQRQQIVPLAWSPLAGGRLFDPENASSQRLHERLKAWKAVSPELTIDQLALAWIRQSPSSPRAILGTNKIEHLQQAAKSLDLQLTREQWYQLWTDAKGHAIP